MINFWTRERRIYKYLTLSLCLRVACACRSFLDRRLNSWKRARALLARLAGALLRLLLDAPLFGSTSSARSSVSSGHRSLRQFDKRSLFRRLVSCLLSCVALLLFSLSSPSLSLLTPPSVYSEYTRTPPRSGHLLVVSSSRRGT